MRRRLMDLLACPICKKYPLDLHVFLEREEIVEGMIVCLSCNRWYPIIEEIPHMLPDEHRRIEEDRSFLKKWKKDIPQNILRNGKPFNLE